MLRQHNSFHLVKKHGHISWFGKSFQKKGLGKWLEIWKSYEFVSQIGQPQPGPFLFPRSVQLFLGVEMKLAFAMLRISDEAEGLLNRIFRRAL